MSYLLEGDKSEWEVVIGLEVHAQITAKSKLFSGASAEFGAEPNSQVSLVDAALPGMLPVINQFCIEQAVKTGLGLKAKINLHSIFERKNYFYPDLPQGYQISQFQKPIVGEGILTIDMPDGIRNIGIERLHIEQDAGKSLHDQDPKRTFIDLNRSGVALMEIVSKPDLRSPQEAGEYVKKLRMILRYLGTCDGNMEEGSLRCDANVSVREVGEKTLRTRAEIKNINSIRFVMAAIEYEALRQISVYDEGEEVVQETRLYDPNKDETRSMRSKEEAHDYRYFPDPDLLPVFLEQEFVDGIKKNLPELPDAKKKRFIDDFGLTADDVETLVEDFEISKFYEKVAEVSDPKLSANWVIHELFAILKKEGLTIVESPVSVENLAKLINLISDKVISGRTAKDVFEIMAKLGSDPVEIVEERGLKQITNSTEIEAMIDSLIKENPEQAEQYRNGNTKVVGWFVGQMMKASKGKANPQVVGDLLAQKLVGK
ncbi:MAG: Asp-tRNA(Asn)/Glu-tRNA(Gln) amidotransferase GatCAB subunit B [Rhodospirillaceae bacterium]|nr:Asp-tRNA(Asn)/Glu-tRNA(Gln) amidotransferase GatCAB subunit B [Rhodospirillaceae bacterium]OUT76992.1 MAG: aspartyl/glutamyl-tRNA amidotransferase subunit B [Rhodospirillaceae bacterium TMED23]|tara:strand:+ start:1233 stop:2690 length:1458 start_codon:yes stop_codon:yes gene_type:complete